jgi:hypothetical protein
MECPRELRQFARCGVCLVLMPLMTAWKAGPRLRCHLPTCFGVIDMPGSAIHLAICGLFVRRRKF